MNKNINFERTLPKDYVLVKHVDAKNSKKIIWIYSILSFVPFLIITPILYFIAKQYNNYDLLYFSDSDDVIRKAVVWLIFCIILIIYMILHELVHGITYKYFTNEKLKYGFTLTVAFCGVPEIYVRKKASIFALIMPFIVFTIIFLGLTVGLWYISPLYGIFAGIDLSIHLGGCVGDLHWTLLYLTEFRKCNTLMRDTGPEQWLYIPKEEAEKYNIPYTFTNKAE